MNKYAEIIKAMAECAGSTCGPTCPYKGKSEASKSCRVLLLEDAMHAIVGEEVRADAAEAERDKLAKECGELKDYALALEKEGQEARAGQDNLRIQMVNLTEMRDKLLEENKTLHADVDDLEVANNTLRAERNGLRAERDAYANECKALTMENKALREKTDNPSVYDAELVQEVGKLIAQAKYQEGRADTLAEIVERCSFGGGGSHE